MLGVVEVSKPFLEIKGFETTELDLLPDGPDADEADPDDDVSQREICPAATKTR